MLTDAAMAADGWRPVRKECCAAGLFGIRPPREGERFARHGSRHRGTGVGRGLPGQGGFYGDEPSLTDLDNGDLRATNDFRDVYGEIISESLGADPAPSVGAGRRSLGFL